MTNKRNIDLEKIEWVWNIAFEAYGVVIGLRSNSDELKKEFLASLPNILPLGWSEVDLSEIEYQFSILTKQKRKKIERTVYKKEEIVIHGGSDDVALLDQLESQIRITIAEFSKEYVFIHAGVVARNNKAIMIPGRSFAGKTTLTAELCKRGFDYYSDEYAVLDKDGLVHPFPKTLSMRGIIDDWKQVEIAVETLGGQKGIRPIQIGLILVTKYKKNSKFLPKELSSGKGIIESLDNSVSIRQNPGVVLSVLTKVTNQAKVMKTNRSEAPRFADRLLDYLDSINL